ncbi:Mrx19p SCDLUD_000287 [Saccharomycodes ludwigii]|uniref:Mrx19p n=1 Tax=Saccharomycodes ludwigii TaxID=36035 RepID=UPI001E84A3CD|nr:hypothetical protein SCDLUD_000287 [Saccharomycodes ludwigii]KAH3902703.1 hypothetical protein SCDLUD_000287 [Saccharomycodes ludwigii]
MSHIRSLKNQLSLRINSFSSKSSQNTLTSKNKTHLLISKGGNYSTIYSNTTRKVRADTKINSSTIVSSNPNPNNNPNNNTISDINNNSIKKYLNEPIKLIVVPISKDKIFLYYKHADSFLNINSKLIKYETILTKKATKFWNNMEKSSKNINRKIVGTVNRLLNRINWTENSLITIPSESYILKRVSSTENNMKITLQEYLRLKKQSTSANVATTTELKLNPIKVYYPGSLITPKQIVKDCNELWKDGLKQHQKNIITCLITLPLTLPLAILPIIPNIPGFYLLYRLYCNVKAYLGAKHLKTMCNEQNGFRFKFVDLKEYSAIFNESEHLQKKNFKLLDEETLARIVDKLEVQEIKGQLTKAIRQEKSLKENNTETKKKKTK